MRKAMAAASAMILWAGIPARGDGKASRMPDLGEAQLRELGANRAASGTAIINLSLTTGHAPNIAKATSQVAQALRNDAVSPRLLRELAILRTAHVARSEYEFVQHVKLARGCGYPQAKIDAVPNWTASNLFDDKERVVLAYVDQFTRGGNVDDAAWSAMEKTFTPREIVEFSITIGNYYGNGLLTRALRVKLETTDITSGQGKC